MALRRRARFAFERGKCIQAVTLVPILVFFRGESDIFSFFYWAIHAFPVVSALSES